MRTINRQPYSVKQLSYGDIKYKFFNHSNWKGVCDDKNYLSIDQETFADSNNVYVDGEGVLRSRPSLKIMTIEGLQDVVDVWTFGPWQVYQVGSIDSYKLVFRKGDTIAKSNIAVSNEFKLVLADEKIFVFEKNNLSYFDTVTNEFFSNATSKIYVPVTQTVSKGVSTDNESPNVLTTSYITHYLYNQGESMLNISGKTGTVTIGDNVYTLTFQDLTNVVLVKSVRILTTENYMDGEPLVFVNSAAGFTMIGEWNDESGYTLYWSNDDNVFTRLPVLPDQLSKDYTILPAISQSADHVYAVLYKDDGPYAYTIFYAKNTNIVPFNTWTKLTDYFTQAENIVLVSYSKIPALPGTSKSKIKGIVGYYFDEKIYAFSILAYEKDNLTVIPKLCDCMSVNDVKKVLYRNIQYVVSTSSSVPLAILTTYCNKDFFISYVNYTDAKNSARSDYVVRRLSDFTDISGIPSIFKYSTNTSKANWTIIKYAKQIQISAVGKSVSIDILLPKVYKYETSIASQEACQIHRIGFNYTEELYNTLTDYSSIVYSKYIPLPDTVILPVEHSTTAVTDTSNITYYIPILSDVKYIIASYVNNILIYSHLLYSTEPVKLMFNGIPVSIGDYFYIVNENKLYTSKNLGTITVDVTTEGELNFDVFDHETELSNYFVSKGKNLYINAQGQNVEVDDFQWYFPERNIQEFDYEITNLHPISTTEIAVFLRDSIYYVKPTTITLSSIETVAYSYYKSRIPLGCEEGSDVITSYDNKYTMFVTKRGFVAMSYQDFIASEEQALTFLSDEIYDLFNEWNIGGIKLCQYNFWIILYRPGIAKAFIFDMRSNSWWPVEYNSNGKKLIEIDRKLYLLNAGNDSMYYFDKGNDKYYDGNKPETGRINWHLTSQKLHLDAINYYKHIINLTLYGYNYDNKELLTKFNLRVINYRKQTDTNEIKSFESVEYKIELTRTFVKRINYYKVNQVQYILESCRDIDQEDSVPTPLCLTAISLKYLVTGQVR